MDFRLKIHNFLDFNNPYTIKKFLGVCEHEFSLMSKKKDEKALKYIQEVVKEVCDDLEKFCKENPNKTIYLKRVKGLLEMMENEKTI